MGPEQLGTEMDTEKPFLQALHSQSSVGWNSSSAHLAERPYPGLSTLPQSSEGSSILLLWQLLQLHPCPWPSGGQSCSQGARATITTLSASLSGQVLSSPGVSLLRLCL